MDNSFQGITMGGKPYINGLQTIKTVDSTTGIIWKNSTAWLHDFNPPGTDGGNIWLGSSGNFTMAMVANTYEAARNIGIGDSALNHLTTGYFNIGIGWNADHACTTGAGNVAIGGNANPACTTGFDNIAIGDDALWVNTTSSCCTAVGHLAGATLVASGAAGPTTGQNTFIGYMADVTNAAIKNTLVNATAIGAGATLTASNSMVFGNASVTANTMYGTLSVPILSATTSLSSPSITSSSTLDAVTITATGTINANYVGANMRLKADASTAKDGFVGATAAGILYFGNWDLNRGWKINADGTMGSLSTGYVGLGTTSPDRIAHAEVVDATTNAVTYALRLTHTVSGAGVGAAGLGTGIEFELETATNTTMKVAGTIDCVWTTPTAGSEVADLVLSSCTGGTNTEHLRIVGADNSLIQTSVSDTLNPVYYWRRALAGPAAVTINKCLGGFLCQGYHSGGAYSGSVGYAGYWAAENFTNVAQGTYFMIGVTPIGGTSATSIMKFMSDGSLQLYETTAPGVAEANGGKLFLVDNGAGKTQLKIQFQSGAAQLLATEP